MLHAHAHAHALTLHRTAAKRACDQCNKRRVKCDGQQPCRTCLRSTATCTFNNPIRRKGPVPDLERRAKTTRQAGAAGGSTALSARTRSSDADVDLVHGHDTAAAVRSLPFLASGGEATLPCTVGEIALAPSTPTTIVGRTEPVPSSAPESVPGVSLDMPFAALPCDDTEWDRLLAQVIAPARPFMELEGTALTSVGSSLSDLGCASQSPPLGHPIGSAAPTTTNAPRLFSPLVPRYADTPDARDISPVLTLCLDTLIRPQITIFFDRIAPMIPIFSLVDIQARLDRLTAIAAGTCWQQQGTRTTVRDKDCISLVLAMTALSLVHPLTLHESIHRAQRIRQAQILIDEALRLRDGWSLGDAETCSVEAVMTSFLVFGALYEMGYRAQARLRLREAVALGEALGLDDGCAYFGLARREAVRRLKTFWVLSVTERAYSLQHGGKIVFASSVSTAQVLPTADGPSGCDDDDDADDRDEPTPSLEYLAHLFSHLDQDLLACWNGRCAGIGACRSLTESRAVHILRQLGGTAGSVFGRNFERHQRAAMAESQRADLLITWQWLRNRIWRLAARHGMTNKPSASAPVELSDTYLAHVAIATLEICNGLATASMDAHGAGFVQKLYDIASAVPDLLRDDLSRQPGLFSLAQRTYLDGIAHELYGYVARYRAGQSELVAPLGEAIAAVALG